MYLIQMFKYWMGWGNHKENNKKLAENYEEHIAKTNKDENLFEKEVKKECKKEMVEEVIAEMERKELDNYINKLERKEIEKLFLD